MDRLRGVVASPVSLSIKVLGPLIIQFQKANPSLSVRLQMSDQLTDLVGSGVDVTIRGIEAPADSSLIAMRLGALDRVLVASPDYLGIAMLPRAYVAADLSAGPLQQLDLDADPISRSIYAVYSDRRYLPRRARELIEFLRNRL